MIVELAELREKHFYHQDAHEAFGDGVYENSFGTLSFDLEAAGYKVEESPFYADINREIQAIDADDSLTEEEKQSKTFDALLSASDGPPDYGVCDSIDQVLARWDALKNSPRKFVIGVFVVTKEHFPDWRWHKWGEYIGTHTPQHEHLGDEEGIDQVVVFSVHEILEFPAS